MQTDDRPSTSSRSERRKSEKDDISSILKREELQGASIEYVDDSKPKSSKTDEKTTGELIGLKDESSIGTGMAGFMKLARQKGVLDEDKGNVKLALSLTQQMKDDLHAKEGTFHTIEDKFRYDHDIDRLGHRRLGRFDGTGVSSGRLNAFTEKLDYKPHVKLTYTDGDGHKLNEKEAFRLLSHKFHGKQSGKLKHDKRRKKRDMDDKVNRNVFKEDTIMSGMLKKAQEQDSQAFVVLTGAEAGTGTKKRK